MPSLPPYLPPKDAQLNNWLGNFSTLITAAPATYGLAAGDATTIAGSVATWAAAYAAITSPTTKTKTTVSAKNLAKINTLAIVRPYAQTISLNPGVTSANKIALGLNPRTSTPTPITAPTSNPILTFQSAANLSAIVRYRDSAASVSVKSKPYGVVSCEVYGMTSATPVTNPALLPYFVSSTKAPALLAFPTGTGGMQFYAAARWKTRTGLYSPWSPIINFTIPQAG